MQAHTPTGDYRAATKATMHLVLWTLAWVASLALARFGPGLFWDAEAASWAAVAANLAAGIGWIIAHARFLPAIDELQRKIMQDALAITLGIGWVGAFAYVVARDADLIAHRVDIGIASVLLAAVYMAAIAIGHLRYR